MFTLATRYCKHHMNPATPPVVPPYPSPLITDADRRAAAVLAEWMIELGLDEDMLAVAQEGFEHHLAIHRSTYATIAVEAARKDWERDREISTLVFH